MANENSVSIPLADTIRALRGELSKAIVHGKHEELRFALDEVELELQMEVSAEAGADAGIRFGVVSIGAKGSASEARTHVIKLKLKPELNSGGRVIVSDEEGE